ncbi:ABC transporter permease subunit [Halalkalibacterium halodurans]|uniref:Maltose/maltodextrin transport system (Permease) n=1 Tax=Halalkalibacterium halodurans (strain ATCC BAA-125 / DSM 18197 / FERM 7344 / JCM 9153 / C-125) TaxID=272558 RepID=Q9KBA8_HALH5|nr:sugar ABC transporter permease [Halalkalibacterium halodurans]MED4080844.1 ABC transporter permease subunit [Halalkalibacterium halodurans]MED4086088.1 ABC transporter permease subunit [Halalkalibacterium halodurans]MED4106755.1 ABC transporter permease subunit [Halalkalibacterium halodurans]MED4109512.1 ABC transporter permease subunit [Halalkalibacterium halodurans]MED4123184.1 ABC transporter permease subunit [Halalkalibacterium halodurans]
MQHRKIALLLSVIPGLGQFYNRQWVKGLLFLFLAISFLFVFGDLLNMGFWGLFTLGTQVPRDNSIFLLAEGIIAVIVTCFGLAMYYINLRDAYKNGELRDENRPLHSLKDQYRNLVEQGYPYLVSGPSLFILIFAVIFPILFSFALAFTNYNLYHSPPANLVDWVGLETFSKIFTVDIWRATFFDVLSWTVIWTLVASTFQVSLGILLAVVVNQKDLQFKKFFRTILILPWAVPGFVTILIFAGLFNDSFGAINNDILAAFGIDPIPWMTNSTWTKVALITIQGWLGFPYIFLVTTGVLQSIPDDLYEAATIDGASVFSKFRHITLPMILIAIAPVIITQFTFNFNNFNIIYLFNGGGPAMPGSTAGGTDILVSWIYKLTMQSSQYSLAAALTILLSIFVISIALWQFRRTNSFKEGA